MKNWNAALWSVAQSTEKKEHFFFKSTVWYGFPTFSRKQRTFRNTWKTNNWTGEMWTFPLHCTMWKVASGLCSRWRKKDCSEDTRTHTHQHAPHAYAVNHWLTSCENWGGQSTPWSLTNKHTDYLTGQNFQLTTGKLKQEQTTGQTFRRFVQFIDVGSVLVSIRPSSKKEGGMKLQRDERQKITAFQI